MKIYDKKTGCVAAMIAGSTGSIDEALRLMGIIVNDDGQLVDDEGKTLWAFYDDLEISADDTPCTYVVCNGSKSGSGDVFEDVFANAEDANWNAEKIWKKYKTQQERRTDRVWVEARGRQLEEACSIIDDDADWGFDWPDESTLWDSNRAEAGTEEDEDDD